MILLIAILKNSKISQKNIDGEELQVLRKASLIEVFNKFIF